MSDLDIVARTKAEKAEQALVRAADGARATAEYRAREQAVDANTVRLRALRLAKEQSESADVAKPVSRGRRSRQMG